MPVFPNCDFPLLDPTEVIGAVRSAVSAREPFSLIRLGDGEAIALSYGEDSWLQDLRYLHDHWGDERVPLSAVAEVKADLDDALRGADLIGIRNDIIGVSVPPDLLQQPGQVIRDYVVSTFPLRPEEIEAIGATDAYRSTLLPRRLVLLHDVLSRIEWSEGQRFCSQWIHWDLLTSGALDEMLEGMDHVGLVTSRPALADTVAGRFGVRTRAVAVPDKFKDVSGAGHHVPDRYRTMRSSLDFPEGTLVLVGAGIPGKVYCQWLKESGCIAVDIGSVFDVWVGRASRPLLLQSYFGTTRDISVPDDLRLEAPAQSGQHRLMPRWKRTGVPG